MASAMGLASTPACKPAVLCLRLAASIICRPSGSTLGPSDAGGEPTSEASTHELRRAKEGSTAGPGAAPAPAAAPSASDPVDCVDIISMSKSRLLVRPVARPLSVSAGTSLGEFSPNEISGELWEVGPAAAAAAPPLTVDTRRILGDPSVIAIEAEGASEARRWTTLGESESAG